VTTTRNTAIRNKLERARLEREDREGAALGLLSLVLLVLIDLCYQRHNNLSGTFVMAPVLAAALARPAIVGGVGVLSTAAAAGLVSYDQSWDGSWVKVLVVVVGSVVGLFTARHRQAIQDRTVRLKSIVEAAESALLRPLPDRVGPASLAGWHASATAEAHVGGDFYEAVPFGTKARWIIGDVRGHGIDAIRLGAAALGAFREAASRLTSLPEVAARVDESLAGFLGDEDFVTAIFGELGQDGTLTLVNCGHPAPFALDATSGHMVVVPPTTPLGLEPDLLARTSRLSPGEAICFYTDGLGEVRTASGRGLDPAGLGRGLDDSSAAEAAGLIQDRWNGAAKSDRFDDDVSVLVVKFVPLTDLTRPRLRVVSPGRTELPAAAVSSAVTSSVVTSAVVTSAVVTSAVPPASLG
jgi:hypothetical protein